MSVFDFLPSPADVLGHFTGRRDRDHSEHREDRLRRDDRVNYLTDRKHMEAYDSAKLQRMVADANAAGLHPLATLNTSISSPVLNHQAQSYGGTGSTNYPRMSSIDSAGIRLSEAQARLVGKQADLVDEQIQDSQFARQRELTPDKIDLTNPTRTPHLQTGKGVPWKTNPNWVDAEALTKRYGESEMLEMALAIMIGASDYQYNQKLKGDSNPIKQKYPGAGGHDGPDFLYKFLRK